MMYEELIRRLRRYVEIEREEHHAADLEAEAADAIEKLGDWWAMADKLIKMLEMPRWIDVTERLPEHERNVLICYEWTGRSGTVYREVGTASIEELERDPTELFRPLYWMPIPEPPKEEQT